MKSRDTRAASFLVLLTNILGLAVLATEFTKTYTKDRSARRFRRLDVYRWNIIVSTTLLALLLSNLSVFAWRVIRAHRLGQKWKSRQRKSAILFFTEAAVQSLNLLFYLIPNVYIYTDYCLIQAPFTFWCGWVRWTCWNTLFMLFLVHAYGAGLRHGQAKSPDQQQSGPRKAEDLLGIDTPWRNRWPCLIPWVVVETVHSVAWLRAATEKNVGEFFDFCHSPEFNTTPEDCGSDEVTRVFIDLAVAFAVVGFGITCFFLLYKLRAFRHLPYTKTQAAIVFYRFQLRLRTLVMAFFALCLVLLWLVQPRANCISFQFAWLGLMPMQMAMTANAFVMSFMAMPHNPSPHAAALQVWLQEFAWTEADKPVKLAARRMTRPRCDNQEALFCFETMMHLLYWSCLVYDYQRASIAPSSTRSKRRLSTQLPKQSPSASEEGAAFSPRRTVLSLPIAMSLYNLKHSELFWELELDTRCLVAWSSTQIVVSFRGTASMRNAVADMQVWRVAHPPLRGQCWLFTRPLVHVGFLKSWLAGGLNQKVVGRIMQLVAARPPDPAAEPLKIYITGHSLGGALATLAAFDIKKELLKANRQDVKLSCYSFGAPRTGNHAFAREYNRMVPDTWSVINDQDVVTRGGKVIYLYKRASHRVILNELGHMIVSPSLFEASLQQNTAGQSVDQHFLASYYHAVLAIILAQFSKIGFEDGMAGVIRLVQSSPYIKELVEVQMGMQLQAMQYITNLALEDQGKHQLPGAHLPQRGFYYAKTPQPKPLLQSSPGRWSQLTQFGSFLRLSKTPSRDSLNAASSVASSGLGRESDSQGAV